MSVHVFTELLSMATDGALMAPLRNPAAPAEDPRREINPGNDGAEMPPEMVRFPDVWLFWKITVLDTFPVMVIPPVRALFPVPVLVMHSRPVVESISMALATVMPPLMPSVVGKLVCVDFRKIVPVPAAFEWARLRVPLDKRVTPPVNVLLPERVSAPGPVFVSAEPLPSSKLPMAMFAMVLLWVMVELAARLSVPPEIVSAVV